MSFWNLTFGWEVPNDYNMHKLKLYGRVFTVNPGFVHIMAGAQLLNHIELFCAHTTPQNYDIINKKRNRKLNGRLNKFQMELNEFYI